MSSEEEKESSQRWFDAAHRGDLAKLTSSRRKGMSLDESDQDGWTALMYAAYGGRIECVKWLLTAGASPNGKPGSSKISPLCLAAESDEEQALQALIKAGARLDSPHGVSEATALGVAAKKGHVESLRCLISAGSDLETRDRYGLTALLSAARGGSVACFKILIDAGAELDVRCEKGRGVDDWAKEGCMEAVRVERERRAIGEVSEPGVESKENKSRL